MNILIENLQGPGAGERPVEIVERKGLGHPDTICDLLSEQFSVALSKHYLEHFGLVLHHNVDKALLAAGRSEPVFGGGRIIGPWTFFCRGAQPTPSTVKSCPSGSWPRQPRPLGSATICTRSTWRQTSTSIA